MKRILYGLVLLISTTAFSATPPVDEQINTQFKKNFPAAKNPKWYEYENFYEVIFDYNEQMCRVKYDLKGKIIQVLRYYHEKDLALFIVAKVKGRYPDKKIFGITEVTSEAGIIYNIILEDDKNWFNLTSRDNGDITLVKKYKKA